MDFFDDVTVDEELYTTENESLGQYDGKRYSCSFTGHRVLTKKESDRLVLRLHTTVQYLISQGVTEFHTGGAVGFDTLAAVVVCQLKKEHDNIKLILEIPYENQMSEKWTDAQKRHYKFAFDNADEIYCHSEKPKDYIMAREALFKRNRILIDKSYYCVCYLKKEERSGTAYTVNYANKRGAHIINLAEE